MKVLFKASLATLVCSIVAGNGLAENQFRLTTKAEQIPEIGIVTNWVVGAGSYDFTFRPPPEWKLRSQPLENKVTLISPDWSSALGFRIVWTESFLNPAANSRPDEFRTRLLKTHPEAKIRDEFPCYSNDSKGWGFDFEQLGPKNLKLLNRVAFIPFTGGVIEVSLTSPPENFLKQHQAFSAFLTSFQIENIRLQAFQQ